MRTVRIATYQLPAEVAAGETPGEIKEREVDNLLVGLRQACEARAILACFGETCTTSHVQAPPATVPSLRTRWMVRRHAVL